MKTLVHRVLMICSKIKLSNVLNFDQTTLLNNGYAEDIITSTIKYKYQHVSTKRKFGQEKCPEYLRLTWISNILIQLLEGIKWSVNHCFNLVKLWVILKSDVLFPPNLKDSVNVFQNGYLIHKFSFKYVVCNIKLSVTIPPQTPDTSTSSNHFDILGRWSSSGPDRGIAHFFTATRNTIEGVGEKEQTNKTNLCKTRSDVTLYIPVSIYRLCLRGFLAKILQPVRSADLSWFVFPHCSGPHLIRLVSLLSGVDCPVRRPSPTAFFEFHCPTLRLAFPSYFRSRRDLESKPFVWFRTKTDKGIVCLADHLNSVTAPLRY